MIGGGHGYDHGGVEESQSELFANMAWTCGRCTKQQAISQSQLVGE